MRKKDSKIIYDKLVRDKIPDIIMESGKYPEIEIISEDNEFHEILSQKIIEEGQEYLETKEIQEIADILEIIDALLQIHNVSLEEIRELQKNKREKRGSFEKRIKLLSVSTKCY